MNKRTLAGLFLAPFFGIVTPALAGEITAVVDPAVLSVSLSTGTSVPAATYKVKVTNTGSSNTLNNPRFVGTTTVWKTDPSTNTPVVVDAKADFRSFASINADINCFRTSADATSIECDLPPLAPNEYRSFEVTFNSPTAGEWIQFAWQPVFDLGTPPGNSNGDPGWTKIELDPILLDMVTSHVPGNVAVTFFTGYGVATKQDPWVTIVKVPAGSTETTASVDEFLNVDCPVGVTECSSSDLSIPLASFTGTELLEITLRRDESTIPRGAKIADAVVYYKKDGALNYEIVPSCSSDSSLPKANQPCEDLDKRKAYANKSSRRNPVEPDFLGDWEFVIKARDNGKYAN